MKYHEIKVGEKTLKLRIRMRDHADLDKACGGDFIKTLTEEERLSGKIWELLGDTIFVAQRAYEAENGKYTRPQVDELLDTLIDDGWAADDAAECMMQIAAVSGYFPREVAEAIRSGEMFAQEKAATA